ncbi:MAG: deoxyguanosinetriphosphate triphosphohydrolase [Lachnospiraceae bacterium]|jgi:dGTPase|nr:deoxyguanosinetriphosphate triphosphohydrolase [Lachnospiraceae bacterium]
MLIRTELETRELDTLSPYASFAAKSAGRVRPEEECDIRTCYMRDRDRIVHCKSFRRLKDKTQVFLSPQGDHYRTRMMHTLEVSQTARTVAKCLRLNEDLVEAIALGHDLGHTPFGHAGERTLDSVCPDGFRHYEQSIRVVDILEKDGNGLNLTAEVRDGILNHGTSRHPSTLEGQVVRLCDKISYVHHDMDDAERAGILTEESIPENLRRLLGNSTRERLNTFIHDIVKNSRDKDHIEMSEEIGGALFEMRQFMFDCLYTNPTAKSEETKASKMLVELYGYYTDHPDKMTGEYQRLITEKGEKKERVVCDYISGMTDQYSIAKFKEIFVPLSWSKY